VLLNDNADHLDQGRDAERTGVRATQAEFANTRDALAYGEPPVLARRDEPPARPFIGCGCDSLAGSRWNVVGQYQRFPFGGLRRGLSGLANRGAPLNPTENRSSSPIFAASSFRRHPRRVRPSEPTAFIQVCPSSVGAESSAATLKRDWHIVNLRPVYAMFLSWTRAPLTRMLFGAIDFLAPPDVCTLSDAAGGSQTLDAIGCWFFNIASCCGRSTRIAAALCWGRLQGAGGARASAYLPHAAGGGTTWAALVYTRISKQRGLKKVRPQAHV